MKHLFNVLKGIFIGGANTIPGVSGGTIAVITGLYDPLIASISNFFKGGEGGWKKNTFFLAPVLAGVALGLVFFSYVIVWGREAIPVQMSLLFAGLILGSLPFVIKIANQNTFKLLYLIPFLLSVGLLVFMALINRAPEEEVIRTLNLSNGIYFFLTAVIGMGAMIVPGISGSFLLLLLGTYSTFITAIKEFNIALLVVFGVGALFGLLVFSKLINILLIKFHGWTYWAITGLITGSIFDVIIRALATESLQASYKTVSDYNVPLAIASFVIGLAAALILSAEKKVKHIESKK